MQQAGKILCAVNIQKIQFFCIFVNFCTLVLQLRKLWKLQNSITGIIMASFIN